MFEFVNEFVRVLLWGNSEQSIELIVSVSPQHEGEELVEDGFPVEGVWANKLLISKLTVEFETELLLLEFDPDAFQ